MSKVSVIIPTYNVEKYISEAVNSVLGQTFKDFEIIIIDDGSSDGTPGIVNEYAAKYETIRSLTNKRSQGPGGTRNTGIDAAQGEWIAFLDADDVWKKDKLEKQIALSDKCGEVGFVFTNFLSFPEENEDYFIFGRYEAKKYKRFFSNKYWNDAGDNYYVQKRPIFAEMLRSEVQIKTPSAIVKRSILSDIRFDEELVLNEDVDFFSRILLRCKSGYIDLPLVKIRRHGQNVDSNLPEEITTQNELRFCSNLLEVRDSDQSLTREEKVTINFTVSQFHFYAGYRHFRKRDFVAARKEYEKSLSFQFQPKVFFALLKICIAQIR